MCFKKSKQGCTDNANNRVTSFGTYYQHVLFSPLLSSSFSLFYQTATPLSLSHPFSIHKQSLALSWTDHQPGSLRILPLLPICNLVLIELSGTRFILSSITVAITAAATDLIDIMESISSEDEDFPTIENMAKPTSRTLDLRYNYAPHWTPRDAFREIVQNWCVPRTLIFIVGMILQWVTDICFPVGETPWLHAGSTKTDLK